MKKLSNVKAFFLDFDGVIIESAGIKTKAFYDLFIPYGKHIAQKAMEYHIKHQGVNRVTKFAFIAENFLKQSYAEADLQAWSEKFSKLIFKKIIKAPLVKEVESFLKLKYLNIPKFILSATPHAELMEICKIKGIEFYFKEIRGAPDSKVDIGKYFLKKYGLNYNSVCLIGDSIEDYNASEKLGTYFIGMVSEGKENPFNSSAEIINNFCNL